MSVPDVKHLARGGQYTRVRISLGGLASAPRGRLLRRRPSLASMSPSGPGLDVESSPGRDAMRVTVSDVVSPSVLPAHGRSRAGLLHPIRADCRHLVSAPVDGQSLIAVWTFGAIQRFETAIIEKRGYKNLRTCR